jgi:ketosteroid isomerase-like protein
MDKRAEMVALCDRFFDAIEANDYPTLESCCAPEYVVWHSHDMLYEPRDSNMPMLKRGMETKSWKRYANRRVMPFEGGFVQQHDIWREREDGTRWVKPVLFIAYVVNGKISRIYEYFNRTPPGTNEPSKDSVEPKY